MRRLLIVVAVIVLAANAGLAKAEGEYEVTVYGGWTLVAGPGITPEEMNIFCVDVIYGWNAETQGWEMWTPGFPHSTLGVMEPTRGYWMHCDLPQGAWVHKTPKASSVASGSD